MTDFVITPSTVLKGIYVSSDPRVDIQFEVQDDGRWMPVDGGIIQRDSRYLAWYRICRTGYSMTPRMFRGVAKWRLSESTITNPTFERICFESLTPLQQA